MSVTAAEGPFSETWVLRALHKIFKLLNPFCPLISLTATQHDTSSRAQCVFFVPKIGKSRVCGLETEHESTFSAPDACMQLGFRREQKKTTA